MKTSDLSPPLGYPGGSCQLIERVEDVVRSPADQEKIVQKIEDGQELSGKEQDQVYGLIKEQGRGTQFGYIYLTPHTQYRMDGRGVTVPEVKLALKDFQQAWSKEKSRNSPLYQRWEKYLEMGQKIQWIDSHQNLEIIFQAARGSGGKYAVQVITAIRPGERDPRGTSREDCGGWNGWSREADLNPPLGFGGQCLLVDRIREEVPNPGLAEKLVDKVERGQELTNAEAARIYDIEVEPGAPGTRFKKIKLGPHSQYRMDQRGVTVSEIRLALQNFHKEWMDQRSRKSPQAMQWESDMSYGEGIQWRDPKIGLTIVFQAQKDGVFLVTDYWTGQPDPRPVGDGSCDIKMAELKEAPTPGVQTVVRDGPEETDTQNNRVQDPGLASPGSTGRDIGKFQYNAPAGPDFKVTPRTIAVPGEEYGHPYKDDGNSVTRRTSSEEEVEEPSPSRVLLAYKRRWKPGVRQRRSKGVARMKAKLYRKKNRGRIRQYQKRYRMKNKNNAAMKASNRQRRKYNRKRRASLFFEPTSPMVVAAMYVYGGDFGPPSRPGGKDNKRQEKNPPQERREEHREYQAERNQRKHDALVWYNQKCKPSRRCMERRERYREDPDKYKRKNKVGSVLTAPEIAFVIGPEFSLGYVHSISPMTGMVTIEINTPQERLLDSLPVEVLLRVAVFLTEEDTDAFLNLVDAEIGMEAYDDIDEELVRDCAEIYGKDPESDAFKSRCFELTGDTELGSLTSEQLELINNTLVLDVLEGGGEARQPSAEPDKGDEDIGPEWDPHLIYGEVESDKV